MRCISNKKVLSWQEQQDADVREFTRQYPGKFVEVCVRMAKTSESEDDLAERDQLETFSISFPKMSYPDMSLLVLNGKQYWCDTGVEYQTYPPYRHYWVPVQYEQLFSEQLKKQGFGSISRWTPDPFEFELGVGGHIEVGNETSK